MDCPGVRTVNVSSVPSWISDVGKYLACNQHMSTRTACNNKITRYHHANERRRSTRLFMNNLEDIGGQLRKWPARVVEELESLVTRVGHVCDYLQVNDPVDPLSTGEL